MKIPMQEEVHGMNATTTKQRGRPPGSENKLKPAAAILSRPRFLTITAVVPYKTP